MELERMGPLATTQKYYLHQIRRRIVQYMRYALHSDNNILIYDFYSIMPNHSHCFLRVDEPVALQPLLNIEYLIIDHQTFNIVGHF